MAWKKLGRIFCPDGSSEWMATHAMIPVAEHLQGDRYRIHFTARDTQNRGHGAFLEIDMNDPTTVVMLHNEPTLLPGELGGFDDSGALPNALVKHGDRTLLYYSGINLGVTVKIRNAIGVAEWDEKTKKFAPLFRGPIIDRTRDCPHFVGTPEVHFEDGKFRAWYTACTHWEDTPYGPKHYYHIEYCESADGMRWQRDGTIAVPLRDEHEYALSGPRVVKQDGIYHMWFCARATKDAASYRILHATSTDGVRFTRDGAMGLDVSPQGWDSGMVCYPFVFDHAGKRYMLYNGNDYGKTGFGIAVWE